MDAAYYTPDFEEYRIGYRYEYQHHKHWWKTETSGACGELLNELEDWSFYPRRAKYLDKDDIIECGFELVQEELKEYSHWCKFKSRDWEMYIQLNNKYFPRKVNLKARGHCYWNGNVSVICKSINELRDAIRLLDIK